MVQQTKKGASTSKSSKSTAATTSSKVTSSTSTSTTKTTKTSNVVDDNSGSRSSVVISEVVGGPSHMVVSPTEYVVTQPEIVQKSKEHYIYGGTQIVELGSTIGADLIHHEKNQSTWDGKFISEGGKPGQTIVTITSRSAIITEPVGSGGTETSTTTRSTSSNTKIASADLVKHESDFLKQAATSSKTTTLSSQAIGRDAIDSSSTSRTEKWTDAEKRASSPRNKGNWDGSFTYETTTLKSSDLLNKNESNISKQTSSTTQSAYTTRDTTDSASHGHPAKIPSEQLIDEQRQVKRDAQKLATDVKGSGHPDGKLFTYVKGQSVADQTDSLLESERCIAKKAYVTTDDTEETVNTANSVRRTTSIDAEPRRTYPVSTLNAHPGRVTETSNVLRDNNNTIVESRRGDASDFTTEQSSHSFSTSSTVEKTSASSKVIEIVDGKERVAKETFNESGSMQSKSAEEKFKARSGTGITPTLEYDQKLAEENITYKQDKPDKEPIFDRNYMDAERNVRQIGNDAPIQQTRGTYETTRFDDKTKKYITDVRHSQNDQQLDGQRRITDSIHGTTYGVAPIDNRDRPDRNTTTTTSDTYNRQLLDRATNESQTINSNVDISSSDYVKSTRRDNLFDSKNITDTSTTFTSKVFDDNTNTWRVINESTINEKNVLGSPPKQPQTPITSSLKPTHPGPDNRTSTTATTKHFDKRSSDTSIVKSSTEKNTISQQLYDEKSKTWREVDEKTIKSKRPSLVRYVSKDNDGKYTTIYKRKLFDRRSGTWKVVDEKVYNNNHFSDHIPEVMEDVTNVTTTTYTTKVFDTKTNTWKVVDEKTFTDHQTQVPKDIADEIARDQPDIANITTTTELTKVSEKQNKTKQKRNKKCHSFRRRTQFRASKNLYQWNWIWSLGQKNGSQKQKKLFFFFGSASSGNVLIA